MSCSIQYTLIVEPFKRELLAMLHIVQSCQATNHGQERQYADRNNCENKDLISYRVLVQNHSGVQMDMTRGLLSISIQGEVAGNKILNDTSN